MVIGTEQNLATWEQYLLSANSLRRSKTSTTRKRHPTTPSNPDRPKSRPRPKDGSVDAGRVNGILKTTAEADRSGHPDTSPLHHDSRGDER